MGITATVHQITDQAYLAGVSGSEDLFDVDSSVAPIDLDKAWHAIHYLITGNSELGFLESGEQLPWLAETFLLFSPPVVEGLNVRLQAETVSGLIAKYDARKLNALDIYPGGWDDWAVAYIAPYLNSFATYVSAAANGHKGIAVIML